MLPFNLRRNINIIMKIKSYLDNSATTRQYENVTNVINESFYKYFANPSSLHQLGYECSVKIKNDRESILNSFRNKFSNMIFTSSGTEANNLAIRGTCNLNRRSKPIIISSSIEHLSILNTINDLSKEGWENKLLNVNSEALIDTEMLDTFISEDKSYIISIMHVNNEVGTIQPIDEIAEYIKMKNIERNKENKIYFHVDAIQSYNKIDFEYNNIDYLSTSAHKIHGPKGIGALFLKENLRLIPEITGGGQEAGLRSGTENIAGIVGFAEAIRTKIDTNKIKAIRDCLLKNIEDEILDIKVNSPKHSTTKSNKGMCAPHILNVSFLGTRAEVLLHMLEEDGIYVSTGSACSSNKKNISHVLKSMKLNNNEIEGAIRFSFGAFNEINEVEYVVDKLKKHVNRIRKIKMR